MSIRNSPQPTPVVQMPPSAPELGSPGASRVGPVDAVIVAAGGGKPGRPERDDPGRGRELVLERRPKTKKPRMFRVLLHNDDYTTMEFVVWVLQVVFHRTSSEADHLMRTVHHKGKGVAGIYTRDIAETKAHQVVEMAEENQMPLQCTTEPDD